MCIICLKVFFSFFDLFQLENKKLKIKCNHIKSRSSNFVKTMTKKGNDAKRYNKFLSQTYCNQIYTFTLH